MASTYLQPVSPRRRATAIGLTLIVHALLALLLLRLAPQQFVPMSDQGALATFDVAQSAAPQPQAAERPRERQRERAEDEPPPPRPSAPRQPQPVPTPAPTADTSGVIWLDRDQFAKSDITGKGQDRDRRETADAAPSAPSAKAPYGPSLAPGLGKLYDIEAWVREPTDAELRTYLPRVPIGSWGLVACRTIPGNRVENCRTLGESPVGSGLATGVRRAAWQFQVFPPRENGKPLIGVWVTIRIDITQGGASVRR